MNYRTKPSGRRRGFAMVIVLVAIFIVSIVSVAVYRTLVMHRDTVRRAQWQAQADRLADAALRRSVLKLQADPEYRGETWRPAIEVQAAPEMRAIPAMRAEIVVEIDPSTEEGQPNVHIQITADVPDHPTDRARVFRAATVPIPPQP